MNKDSLWEPVLVLACNVFGFCLAGLANRGMLPPFWQSPLPALMLSGGSFLLLNLSVCSKRLREAKPFIRHLFQGAWALFALGCFSLIFGQINVTSFLLAFTAYTLFYFLYLIFSVFRH